MITWESLRHVYSVSGEAFSVIILHDALDFLGAFLHEHHEVAGVFPEAFAVVLIRIESFVIDESQYFLIGQ